MRSLSLASAALAAVALACPVQAQDLSGCFLRGATAEAAAERVSPLGVTVLTVGGQEAKLCYGRPSVRGRTIFGNLEAYGKPWRMGANEATALHIPFAAEIGGVRVEPGVYALYAIPGENEWEIVVNGQYQRWGIPINEDVIAADVGSFKRPVVALSEPVEQLTFSWESHGDTMGHLVMMWENTRVDIPVHKVGM